jgi:Predicted membrane protein (DUF2207)
MRALAAFLLLLSTAAPAVAKTYSAERFDSHILVLTGGAIEVTETVVFRFEGGPFREVFREIPTRRTDAVEIRTAWMDGRPLPFGEESGQVEVRQGSKVRVRWRFAPRADSTHVFVLKYLVRGVVQKFAGGDRLEWIALPVEHKYRIDSSEVVVEAPAAPTSTPVVEARRVSEKQIDSTGSRIHITARDIGEDGWIKSRLDFADGALIAAAPDWQQRQHVTRTLAPRWATAAAVIFVAGLVLMVGLRLGYDSPPQYGSATSAGTAPDDSRPAIAGALAANGSVSAEHAMAALFALADRGALTIVEDPRRWGQRHFTLHRRNTAIVPAPEEAAMLTLVFGGKEGPDDSVSLATAQKRLQHRLKEFRAPVLQELHTMGLLNEDRRGVRSSYLTVSLGALVLAGILAGAAAILADRFGGWPFLMPAAAAVVAGVGFIFRGGLTPLSNEGVRRAEHWRAYQRYLKEVSRDRAQLHREPSARLLAFAVALGLAGAWSKYLKQHPQHVPSWFQALAAAGDDGFPAFIAAGGTVHGGGAGAGAGGAAGGGASGAG